MASVKINTVPRTSVLRDSHEHDRQDDDMGQEPKSPIVARRLERIDSLPKLRPESSRSSTHPSPSTVASQNSFSFAPSPARPVVSSSSSRNKSPYSRTHLRSRSSGAALSAPAMARAHSSPAVQSATRAPDFSTPSTGSRTPSSPMRSPARQRSPFRPAAEDAAYNHPPPPPRSPGWFESPSAGGAIEAIQEDSELDITPRQALPTYTMPFARSSSLRRRPASPLHTTSIPPNSSNTLDHPTPSLASSGSTSPALAPQKFNEAMPPLLHHYASASSFSSFSSIPSTPTSQRSRSPSITSLDTIEDAPDMEQEAVEADRIEKLRLAAERAESGEDEEDSLRRRSSLDGPRGFGFSRGGNRERKRWSVCGGERRVDLDLDTIWED